MRWYSSTCQPDHSLADSAERPASRSAADMAQNFTCEAAVRIANTQEDSDIPTGGRGQSMLGYFPSVSRNGGGLADQYLKATHSLK